MSTKLIDVLYKVGGVAIVVAAVAISGRWDRWFRSSGGSETCRPMAVFIDGNDLNRATCGVGQTMIVSETAKGVLITCSCPGKGDVIRTLCGERGRGVSHSTAPSTGTTGMFSCEDRKSVV